MRGNGCCAGGFTVVGYVDNLGMFRYAEKVEGDARMGCQEDRRFFVDCVVLKILE